MLADPAATWLLEDGAKHLLDASGRPLGEQAVDPGGVDFERTCPFGDARKAAGKPINAAALRQVGRHWPGVLAWWRALAAAQAPEGQPTAHHVWCVVSDGTLLPAFDYVRSGQAGSPISEEIAALYKASLGFSGVLTSLLLTGRVDADTVLADAWSTQGFYELLDDEEWLVGSHQVCAGPPAMIREAYDLLCAPRGDAQPATPRRRAFSVAFQRFGTAYRELLALALATLTATRAVLASGYLDEVPGYGDRSDRVSADTWPACARSYVRSRARVAELVRAHPELRPVDAARLFPAGRIPAPLQALFDRIGAITPEEPLAALDRALAAASRPVVAKLLGQSGSSSPRNPGP